MRDREQAGEALREYLENPYWEAYYRDAPSDRCREFIALEFFYSGHEDEKTGEAMDLIEEQMDAVELRHLLKYCGNNPRKRVLLRRIAEKEKMSPGR